MASAWPGALGDVSSAPWDPGRPSVCVALLSPEGLAADLLDLLLRVLPAFHSAPSASGALAATIAHNEPLFWLPVVERSLVKHISSTTVSHPAISIPFYLPCTRSRRPPALFRPLRSWKSFPSWGFWERVAFRSARFRRGDALSGRRGDVAARSLFSGTGAVKTLKAPKSRALGIAGGHN